MKLGGLSPATRRSAAAVFDNLHMGGLPPPAQEGVHCPQSQPQPEHCGGPQKSPGCRLEGAGGGRAVPHTPPRASSRLSPARCREVAAADVASRHRRHHTGLLAPSSAGAPPQPPSPNTPREGLSHQHPPKPPPWGRSVVSWGPGTSQTRHGHSPFDTAGQNFPGTAGDLDDTLGPKSGARFGWRLLWTCQNPGTGQRGGGKPQGPSCPEGDGARWQRGADKASLGGPAPGNRCAELVAQIPAEQV